MHTTSEFGIFGKHIRVELHGFGHVSLDLHFAGHECLLRLQLSLSHLAKVSIKHDESAVGLAFFLEGNFTVSVLQVDSDESRLVTLGLSELKVVDTANFVNNLLPVLLENGHHLFENFDRLHNSFYLL